MKCMKSLGEVDELELAEQRALTQDEIESFKEELVFVKHALETTGFKK